MKILVSGASGFIGSALVRMLCKRHIPVRGLIRKTSDTRLAGRLYKHTEVLRAQHDGRLELLNVDLLGDISGVCEGVTHVAHLAAKTFVDHSIVDPGVFVRTNVLGTLNLLEDARRYKVQKFCHISTDEVYGSILEGSYKEDAPLRPTNPYSASKAGADALVQSYASTYGMHTLITRCENCFGPLQHPQKAFPTFTRKAVAGEKLPVYGDGKHVRQWLWVDDHCEAIAGLLLDYETTPGSIWHVAGSQELTNIELARRILDVVRLQHLQPSPDVFVPSPDESIEFIPDHDIRPGHDRRYALDSSKLQALGWVPQMTLLAGITQAVRWYIDNPHWTG